MRYTDESLLIVRTVTKVSRARCYKVPYSHKFKTKKRKSKKIDVSVFNLILFSTELDIETRMRTYGSENIRNAPGIVITTVINPQTENAVEIDLWIAEKIVSEIETDLKTLRDQFYHRDP